VGGKLNVGTILAGSMRKQDSRVRITAQRIKSEDGFHMWSETGDRELNDDCYLLISSCVDSSAGRTASSKSTVPMKEMNGEGCW
jgi:TolB-like protein